MLDSDRAFARILTGTLGTLLCTCLAAAPGAAQYGADHDPRHPFDVDGPVRYLASPHRLNALALDHHQVEAIRHIAHGFHDEYGHHLRDAAHLSHRERGHLKEAQYHARREIIVDVLDGHQRERFIHLYRSGTGHRGDRRYGHAGYRFDRHPRDRHGYRDRDHRDRRHRGLANRHRGERRHHADRHRHRRHRTARHGGRLHAVHVLGEILGVGLRAAFHDDGHRFRRPHGKRHHGHGRGHHGKGHHRGH